MCWALFCLYFCLIAFIWSFYLQRLSLSAWLPAASFASQHSINLSMDLKGSFGKCNLESIGLACGWVCITGFMKLLCLCLPLFPLQNIPSQQQLAADFRLKAEGHPSPAIFQQTVLWNHVYCLQKFWTRCRCFSQLSVFVWLASCFLSCSKSWIKRLGSISDCAGAHSIYFTCQQNIRCVWLV